MENKLASSAILIDFSISVWSGRRQAKEEAADVTSKAKAVKDAAAVSKHLMVGTSELGAVQSAAAEVRRFILYYTLPWSDSGIRLLPMSKFTTFCEGLDFRIDKFKLCVELLVQKYPTIVSAQAFKLGTLFNRADYPSPLSLKSKFQIHIRMNPVPDTGHFLLDAHQEEVEKIKERALKDQEASMQAMMKDAWQRLYGALKKLEGLTNAKRVHESTLGGVGEVTALLTAFNVCDDPQLEAARKELEVLLSGVRVEELRDSENARNEVREKTQSILNKFDFGIADEEDETVGE